MGFSIRYKQGAQVVAGDLGVAGETIWLHDPWGNRSSTVTGTKSEHGVGGFEFLAPQPGRPYKLYNSQGLLLAEFEHMTGGMTFVAFNGSIPVPPPVDPDPPPGGCCCDPDFQSKIHAKLDRIEGLLREKCSG